jgi:hypothetical protein
LVLSVIDRGGAASVRRLPRRFAALLFLLAVGPGVSAAACVGDCPPANNAVSIGELITGVNIALDNRPVSACPSFDANANGAVGVNELIQGVNNALNGCPPGSPTATSIPTETATPGAATLTPTLASGPVIVFRGIAAADDFIYPPTRFENGIPVYELPQGRFFRVIIEAAFGTSGRPPGLATFRDGAAPDLQVQASRALGDGNPQVCDGVQPDLGIPAVEPPRFDADGASLAALNDFGCRFPDGEGKLLGRGCADSGCVLFEDGLRGCVDNRTQAQFCSRSISIAESFPDGETVLSMRVLDIRGAPGPVERMIIRVGPQ